METGIFTFIIVVATLIAVMKLAASAKPKPASGSGSVLIGVKTGPRGGLSHGQLFLPHLASFIAINALGFMTSGLMSFVADHEWSWAFWAYLPIAFGWLAIWGFFVNPIVYPSAYLKWLEAQNRVTEPAFFLHGASAIIWIVIILAAGMPIVRID